MGGSYCSASALTYCLNLGISEISRLMPILLLSTPPKTSVQLSATGNVSAFVELVEGRKEIVV